MHPYLNAIFSRNYPTGVLQIRMIFASAANGHIRYVQEHDRGSGAQGVLEDAGARQAPSFKPLFKTIDVNASPKSKNVDGINLISLIKSSKIESCCCSSRNSHNFICPRFQAGKSGRNGLDGGPNTNQSPQ